jgi:5-dehydro-4-deoxyglucarate dehydratase
MSVQDLSGVLFFPVTPFTAAGPVDTGSLAEQLRRGLAAGPGGVFAARGTGEFHALDAGEYGHVVHIAVEVTGGAVPVLAGAGGPLPMARQFAGVAQEAGAAGLLLMPPYLVAAPPAGLVAYASSVALATELPLIVYQRGNAIFDPETAAELARMPQVAGFKDGLGDIDLLSRIVVMVRRALDGEGKRFQFFNGIPTAEVSVPAYRALGVELYSSAVFCLAPEVSRQAPGESADGLGIVVHGVAGHPRPARGPGTRKAQPMGSRGGHVRLTGVATGIRPDSASDTKGDHHGPGKEHQEGATVD